MKNRVFQWKGLGFPLRKNALELVVEIVPFRLAPEVVNHEKAAVVAIAAQAIDLLTAKRQAPRLHDVDEGMVEEFVVGQAHHGSIRIHLHRGHFVEPVREIQIRVGIIGRPTAAAPAAA